MSLRSLYGCPANFSGFRLIRMIGRSALVGGRFITFMFVSNMRGWPWNRYCWASGSIPVWVWTSSKKIETLKENNKKYIYTFWKHCETSLRKKISLLFILQLQEIIFKKILNDDHLGTYNQTIFIFTIFIYSNLKRKKKIVRHIVMSQYYSYSGCSKQIGTYSLRAHIRVVKVNVDAVRCRLLEREDVDRDAVQDISGSSKELAKVPTLLLIGLQYAGQHWDQLGLQTPTKRYRTIGDLLPNSKGLFPLEILKSQFNSIQGILASHFTQLIINQG